MAVVAEKIIRIDVVASANAQRAINAMATDMKKIESAASNMQRTVSSGFGGLNSVLGKTAGFLGAFGVTVGMGAVARWVIEAANSYQVLESRLSLVLGSYEKAERATQQIADIAKVTGREIDGVAKLYEKAARSAQQFGISEDKVREITLGFSQSIRLSGASTQEAYASLVQFGQALASGRLQGDEFRSLMENNAVFMYEFAKAAGISVSQLRKMGTEGKLSAKFLFDTMAKEGADGLNMMERLNKMAAEVPLTFRQSMTSLVSAATETTGVLAKLFGNEGSDQMGIFGPWIRGLSAITDRLRDAKALSDSMGEGFWVRLMRAIGSLGTPDEFFGGKAVPRKSLLENLKSEKASTLKDIEALQASIDRDAATFKREWGSENASFRNGSPALDRLNTLNARRKELDGLLQQYGRLRKEERSLEYGEGFGAEARDTPKPEPDAAAERRTATARKSLEDFAIAKRNEAASTWALVEGREEEKKTATALLELNERLREAGVQSNSVQAESIRLDIRKAEQGRRLLSEMEERNKAAEKLRGEEETNLEKVNAQILRDTESIDALRNRTRATDELTEAMLRQARADAQAELDTRTDRNSPGGERIRYLEMYIAKLDEASKKKADLMSAREVDKQVKEQGVIDASNAKRVDDLSEDINRRLKSGILNSDGKSIGEALRENIIETVNNTTVDIILNPITSVFSRMLAQLADQFSALLTKSMYERMASSSSDPIGSLIGLLLGAAGGSGSASTGPAGPGLKIPDSMLGPKLATGAAYIPYDDFPARLHRGERVLTAQQNTEYSRGGVNISSNPVITIDARTDQAVVYGIVAEAVRQGNLALVEEMRAQGVIS